MFRLPWVVTFGSSVGFALHCQYSHHSSCCGQDEEGNPKKTKKGVLGLGDRLAAKAAAIAKTAGKALQAVSDPACPLRGAQGCLDTSCGEGLGYL